MARDAELHVGLDVLVVGYVELRDQRLEARLVDQKMQVRGPHVMAAQRTQQFADRAVDWNRVSRGFDAAEADMAVRIGGEFAAQIHVGLNRILVFVKTFWRGLPDI